MGGRMLFTASWVLLAVLTVAVAGLSILSTANGLRRGPDALTPSYSVARLAEANEEAATAVRARRVTAATWALGYALLLGFVVLVPYRAGERWAWWAVLASAGVSQALSAARFFALGTSQGVSASLTPLAIVAIALLLGAPRMFGKPPAAHVTEARP
jgi:hypothetical protein